MALYKICYYVPRSHLEATKAALFDAGAGRVGSYEHCCFQTLGEGQFRPLPGSEPHVGQVGELARIGEYRVDMVCPETNLRAAIDALRAAHPFETPAYDVLEMVDV